MHLTSELVAFLVLAALFLGVTELWDDPSSHIWQRPVLAELWIAFKEGGKGPCCCFLVSNLGLVWFAPAWCCKWLCLESVVKESGSAWDHTVVVVRPDQTGLCLLLHQVLHTDINRSYLIGRWLPSTGLLFSSPSFSCTITLHFICYPRFSAFLNYRLCTNSDSAIADRFLRILTRHTLVKCMGLLWLVKPGSSEQCSLQTLKWRVSEMKAGLLWSSQLQSSFSDGVSILHGRKVKTFRKFLL